MFDCLLDWTDITLVKEDPKHLLLTTALITIVIQVNIVTLIILMARVPAVILDAPVILASAVVMVTKLILFTEVSIITGKGTGDCSLIGH